VGVLEKVVQRYGSPICPVCLGSGQVEGTVMPSPSKAEEKSKLVQPKTEFKSSPALPGVSQESSHTPQEPKPETSPRIAHPKVAIAIAAALIILALIAFSTNSSKAPITSTDQTTDFQQSSVSAIPEQTGQVAATTTPPPSTTTSRKLNNGYDWQGADFQTRQEMCKTIAAAESKEFNHDFTADFYYSALDNFYSSSDPNILNENIDKTVGIITSMELSGQQ
jgi:hypothetical protein